MTFYAPSWAIAAGAVDGVGDPHLSTGAHVRALPSPRAGVPASPLVVYRSVVVPEEIAKYALHNAITWIDSKGAMRTAPFDVTPDNPVTGYLPAGDCVWVELLTTLPPGMAGPPGPVAALTFEALANGPDGAAALGKRTKAPYSIAASRIDMVRVSGSGRVYGVRWMSRDDVSAVSSRLWRTWSLPVPNVPATPRYTPTPNAFAEAMQRVLRGAPKRQPMYVAFNAVGGPGTAPVALPADAQTRVNGASQELSKWLDTLLHDFSVDPSAAVDERSLVGGPNGVPRRVRLPIQAHLIGSALDPDAAHWLGFGDVDDGLKVSVGTLVFYTIRGLWRWSPDQWDVLQRMQLVPYLRATLADALIGFPDLVQLKVAPTQAGAYLDFTAIAGVVVGAPPDAPSAPNIDAFDDLGWCAEPPPPDVRRIVRLRASGFVGAPLAALVATDARGVRPLNALKGGGRLKPNEPLGGRTLLPLTVSKPQTAGPAGRGAFDDRNAPQGKVTYRLAQADWFGRWSVWATKDAAAKARTAPMAPVVELQYVPPVVPNDPPPSGSLSGLCRIRIAVPRIADLPPGGGRLMRLDLTKSVDGGAPTTASYLLAALVGPDAVFEPHPTPLHDVLRIEQKGPLIPQAGSRKIRYTAKWVDEFGTPSVDSAPAVKKLLDPRPPALPAIDTNLRYSARPDAMGWARVELTWPSVAGTRYRVFASTETTLLGALRGNGKSSLANQIESEAPGAERAMMLKAHKSDFGWDAFESLCAEPLVATGATTTFVHRISGSLDVLAVYRVLSEGESGALAEMTQAELVPIAVPNFGAPPQPLVAVERQPEDHEVDGVTLRVKVPAGRAAPVAWRLRRTSSTATDAERMDIVRSGPIAVQPDTDGMTTFYIADPTPLKRWRQYRWVVEVQAGKPPTAPTLGTIPPGEWSAASAPVSLAVIPVAPPPPPTAVVAAVVAGGVQLTITHAQGDALGGTALGTYRLEVFRASPNKRLTKLDVSVSHTQGTTFVATDSAPVPGAQWAVRVVDPLGRVSGTTVSNTI